MASLKDLLSMVRKPFFPVLSAFLTLLVQPTQAQQSSADAVNGLKNRFASDRTSVGDVLVSASENPSSLEDGTLTSRLQTIQSDLSSLANQVEQAKEIISSKSASLDQKGLSSSDLQELKGTLTKQQEPLDQLKRSISDLKLEIDDLTGSKIASWSQTYRTFVDVEGQEAAKAKLKSTIQSYKPSGISTKTR
jgi:chromosome segregation ATPase